jgi:hypothetical protein
MPSRESRSLTIINTTLLLCGMIPALVQLPCVPFRVLPPGIHGTTMEEIGLRFATNSRRMDLFAGFTAVVSMLQNSGCCSIYLNGSFTTEKSAPEDYDGCWDPTGVDATKLDPILLDFTNRRAAQKRKYLGEMFIATMGEASGKTFLEFFQTEKSTGARKGILLVRSVGPKSGK